MADDIVIHPKVVLVGERRRGGEAEDQAQRDQRQHCAERPAVDRMPPVADDRAFSAAEMRVPGPVEGDVAHGMTSFSAMASR